MPTAYEAWPHNGLLISGNAQATSLMDWDLITDSAANAVLCFTDIRAGGDYDIYAYRISPAGAFLWGTNGVALSNDGNFEANSVVAEMTDGTCVFAWMRSVTGAAGRLVVQKLDTLGTPLLGTSALAVYDAASLPIAHKAQLLADGAGGAFNAWHVSVGSFFQGRVQHVNSAGVEVLAHGGIEVSLEANRSDLDPCMVSLAGSAVVATDGTAILAWNDARTDINDVYTQNVEPDGSMGVPRAPA